MSEISPAVQTRMTPLLAFPGGALRLSLCPSLVETQVLVEFYRPGGQVEKDSKVVAGNIEQVKMALDAGILWLARRDGDGKWVRFWERSVEAAANVILPSVVFDWRAL